MAPGQAGESLPTKAMAAQVPPAGTQREASAGPSQPGNRILWTMAGLSPHTAYTYRARTCHREGNSAYTEEQTVTTDSQKKNGLPGGNPGGAYPDGRKACLGLDPVNLFTGAFLWSGTLLEDRGKEGLHFTLMYDSGREGNPGILGKKWTHALHYTLRMEEAYACFCTPWDEETAFLRISDKTASPGEAALGERFQSVSDARYALEEDGEGGYLVRTPQGGEYCFDHSLNLSRIREKGREICRFVGDEDKGKVRMEGFGGSYLDLFCEAGRIRRVCDGAGNAIELTYEGDCLCAVRNPQGGEMRFTYDGAGNLLTLTDFGGRPCLINRYDARGRVTEQTLAERGTSSVTYEDQGKVTVTDPLGNAVTYTYDADGRVTRIEREGQRITNRYNDRGQLIERVDALGNSTQMEYDEYGRMTGVLHPDGTKERVTYDERNNPLEIRGRDGGETHYRYDARGRLVRVQDERGNVCSYAYDEADNLTSHTDRRVNLWTYAYVE